MFRSTLLWNGNSSVQATDTYWCGYADNHAAK